MDDLMQKLLQSSAKLFQHLTTIPNGDERDTFVDQINEMLDERGQIIGQLQSAGFQFDREQKLHSTLAELDKGINSRLALVMDAVKSDMKELNKQKKQEAQYHNPYSHVQVMDGTYYDKKK